MFDKKGYTGISEIIIKYSFFNLNNPAVQSGLRDECANFLAGKLDDDNDLQYLELTFKYNKKTDIVSVFGNNLISTLWLIGIYPPLPKLLRDTNVYTTKDKEYVYTPKTKKLEIINLYVDKERLRHH